MFICYSNACSYTSSDYPIMNYLTGKQNANYCIVQNFDFDGSHWHKNDMSSDAQYCDIIVLS